MSPPQASRKKLLFYVLQTLALSSILFIVLSIHMISGIVRTPTQHQVSSINLQEAKNLFDLEPLFRDKQSSLEFQSSHACYLSDPNPQDFCSNALALANAINIAQKYKFSILLNQRWQSFIQTNLDPAYFALNNDWFRYVTDRLPTNAARLSSAKAAHCNSHKMVHTLRQHFRAAWSKQPSPVTAAAFGKQTFTCAAANDPSALLWADDNGSMEASKVFASASARVFLVAPNLLDSPCVRLITALRSSNGNADLVASNCRKYLAPAAWENKPLEENSHICATL